MKPQDISVLLKILSLGNKKWTQALIADTLAISPSEVSEGMERLKTSGLIDYSKKKVQKLATREFLIHGL